MDADKFLRLLHINEELREICQHNSSVASNLNPVIDDLTCLLGEMSLENSHWLNPE
jgi:hypothetical protein